MWGGRAFEAGMRACLDPSVAASDKAAFLEAARLKGETPDENLGALRAFWSVASHTPANVPILVDLGNAYDGFTRTPAVWVFVAPLLASVGVPALLHGVESVAPKRGVTPHQILKAARKSTDRSVFKVVSDIESPDIGWGYVDQSQSFPELFALQSLRTGMVKRPVISTVEKLLQPVTARHGNAVVSSYTHPPYRKKMADLMRLGASLADSVHPADGLLLRGVEGGIQLALNHRSPAFKVDGRGDLTDRYVVPAELGMDDFPMDPELDAGSVVRLGLDALSGKPGFARETILMLAMTILTELNLRSSSEAWSELTDALRFGTALNHWVAGAST